jgi:NADP-dependent 3-hydroxy acid dehydrogenase YdfG
MTKPRSIFISGGGGGIGLVTAKLFAAAGWRVGIGDVDPTALARANADSLLETFVLDVRDAASWQGVLETFCVPDGGALDALVNNAGVLTYGWFDEEDIVSFARSVDVNVKGVLLGSRIGIAHLSQAANACLVNVGSSASLQASPRLAVYSATKFAVRGLSEALDLEFMRLGVRVACVEPFLVDTPMLDSDDAQGRNYRTDVNGLEILSTNDVAQAVWQAVHGNGDVLHYPVGELPTRLALPLGALCNSERARWRAIFRNR